MLYENSILRACQDEKFLAYFWARVEKTDGCWNWTKCCWKIKGKDTYGCVSLPAYCAPRRLFQAHRISWIITNGRLQDKGMFVCHSCDNMRCVRPDHLHLGSPADNLREAAERNRMPKGEENGNVVLTAEKVREIRRRAATGERRDLLAVEFGISYSTIFQILKRTTWKGIE